MNKITTQRIQILNHLKTGAAISPIEALSLYGSLRLADHIHRLRGQGWKIDTIDKVSTRGSHYAEYKLTAGAEQPGAFTAPTQAAA
ncbi:MAG TPA: helix-turn-helix domain-containing protein [Steroidobacteraceae bacterium]|nr:helix-turn-helix domain-containing protein [Steroidobacteraceae bacterium]